MTATLVSLISIFMGILGGNSTKILVKNNSFDVIGNTIAGVFGSIFFIKFLGRLGFSPQNIVDKGIVNYQLFAINSFVSFFGGFVAVFIIKKIVNKLQKDTSVTNSDFYT